MTKQQGYTVYSLTEMYRRGGLTRAVRAAEFGQYTVITVGRERTPTAAIVPYEEWLEFWKWKGGDK